MGRRSREKWDLNFTSAKLLMNAVDGCKNHKEIENMCTRLRNPIVWDNNVKSVQIVLSYSIPDEFCKEGEKITQDHLIGMSNIVLYIYKNKLHKSWDTVNDFKNTLRSLNVLISVPKRINDNGVFKDGWQFNSDNINDCIRWDKKLKSVGVTKLICNETGKTVSVNKVWNEWYNQYIK